MLEAMSSQAMRNSAPEDSTTILILLRDLIDYAGLFPPASLSMAQAVANYDSYQQSKWNWMLGRFIVPVSRLDEFKEALARLPALTAASGPNDWRLSALLGPDPTSDIARIHDFNAGSVSRRPARNAVIDSMEANVKSSNEIRQLSGIAPAKLRVYFEIPLTCADCVKTIADCGLRAKIRTGGETADKFPAPENVIEFIRRCAASNVPFKATAGLHHPLRSVHHLTYQPESPSGIMHGFINLFLAAAFVRMGLPADLAVQLLEEKSPESFRFDPDLITWREHKLMRDEIAATRQRFAISFGSCSFTEPVDDLKSLHILGEK